MASARTPLRPAPPREDAAGFHPRPRPRRRTAWGSRPAGRPTAEDGVVSHPKMPMPLLAPHPGRGRRRGRGRRHDHVHAAVTAAGSTATGTRHRIAAARSRRNCRAPRCRTASRRTASRSRDRSTLYPQAIRLASGRLRSPSVRIAIGQRDGRCRGEPDRLCERRQCPPGEHRVIERSADRAGGERATSHRRVP